jgi:hypothetical protein
VVAAGARGTTKQPRLVAIGGGTGARELPLIRRKTTIGSAIGNYFVLAEKTVSRRHAVIRRRLRGYDLIDLESTNGTYLNGKRVTNPTRLKRGDEIGFGKARYVFMPGRGASGPGLRVAIPLMLLLFLAAFSLTRRWIRHEARLRLVESHAAKESAAPAAGATLASSGLSSQSLPTPIPTPSGPPPEWLKRLNAYRAMAKVAPVTEDSTLSAGDSAHVKYLVENFGPSLRAGGNPGIDSHLESADKPGYSAVGARAGESSDVDFIAFGGMKVKDPAGWALVDWISGAFHRLPLLSPRLRRVGFNQVCDRGLCVAALDAQSGVEPSAAGTAYAAPIEFPADGATINLRTFTDEWPDPLSACAGYKAPTGLPITLATGYQIRTSLDAYSFERIAADGAASKLDACGFDSSTYTNLDPATQKTARDVLLAQGTVVVIPQAPLTAGASYRVSITASGTHYRWTFSVAR